MAIRHTHGKARSESPRIKDTPRLRTGSERSKSRAASGKFGAGNKAARGRGWKQALRKLIGNNDFVGTLYRGYLSTLAADNAMVRSDALIKARAMVDYVA